MSLVVTRLETTNDGGGGTSPAEAEAKIIAGGPRTRLHIVGVEASRAALTLMRVSQAEVGRSAASGFLEGPLGG